MCWNSQVSLGTALFVYAISFYIYKRNTGYDRWFALVLLAVGTIQWLEFFLWKNLDDDANYYITTYAIPLVLTAEYLLALYGASLFTNVDKRLGAFYIIVAFISLIIAFITPRITQNLYAGLKWGVESSFIQGIGFCALLILPFILYMKDPLSKAMIITITIGTLAFAMYAYPHNWKSYWCLYGNILAFFALIRPGIAI